MGGQERQLKLDKSRRFGGFTNSTAFLRLIVFGDQAWAELGGSCGFLEVEFCGFAGEDLAEIGDVAINGMGAVFGESHGFRDGLSFKKEQSTDFFFVGERGPHVVDGSAAGEELVLLLLPVGDVAPDGGGGGLQHDGEFGGRDAAALGVGFVADAGDGVALDIAESFAVPALLGFVIGNEGDDHRHHARFGNRFAIGRGLVFRDADPGRLASSQVGGGGEELMHKFSEALRDGAARTCAGKLWEFGAQKGFECAEEGLLHLRAIRFLQVVFKCHFIRKLTRDKERVAHKAPFFPLDVSSAAGLVAAAGSEAVICRSSSNR